MHRAKVSAEVAIVGASLAGSACAITLASHDIPVVVLDRSSFPRQKACGEGLSHLAESLLRRLGIHPNLLRDSSQKLYGYRFASPLGASTDGNTCLILAESIRAWGMSRATLDSAVLERLQQLRASRVLTSQPAKALTRDGDSWQVVTQTNRISASYVVLATGSNPQAMARSYVQETRSPSNRVGITSFGKLVRPAILREVCIIPFGDGELYITPLGGNTVNVSAVGTNEFVQDMRDPLRISKTIHDALGLNVTITSQGYGAGHFNAAHRSLDPHLYLIGDAFESFDPRCGLGMTHALMSGIAAAESIISAIQAGDTAVQAHKRYEEQHEGTAQSMRRYSCIIGSFIGAYLRYPQATIRTQRLLGGLSLKLLDQLGPSLETKQPEPPLASC